MQTRLPAEDSSLICKNRRVVATVPEHRQEKLSLKRKQRLNDLGFIWEVSTEQWEEGYAALFAYKERHGHCRMPRGRILNGFNLGSWVSNQRTLQDQLSPERKQRLDSLGFVWNELTARWEDAFSALSAYKEEHGHCRVPSGHKFNSFGLGSWVSKQRLRQEELSAKRKQRLDDLGFVWGPITEQWEKGFAALVAFKEQHDHCSVARGHKFNDFNLGTWVGTQRNRQEELSLERKQRLNDLGFIWDPFTEQWEKGFSFLSAYKKQHDHCRVATGHKFNGFSLGSWVSKQRSRQDRLSAKRKQRLDELGFIWSIRNQSN